MVLGAGDGRRTFHSKIAFVAPILLSSSAEPLALAISASKKEVIVFTYHYGWFGVWSQAELESTLAELSSDLTRYSSIIYCNKTINVFNMIQLLSIGFMWPLNN